MKDFFLSTKIVAILSTKLIYFTSKLISDD
jgi:hypothetical protein